MLSADRRALQLAHVELLESIKPNYALTLKAGLECRADVLQRAAHIFICQVLRRARGRNWADWPSDRWPTVVGFLEHPETDMHLQAVALLPCADLLTAFLNAAPIWRKIRPAGHYYCEPLQHEGYHRYATKDAFKTEAHSEPFIFYRRPDFPDVL